MPLDTSIALGVQAPQIVDPSKYAQMAAEQQMNALRGQVLQQQMQQNALTMQNTMEDRRRAEAARQQSAAEKAALKAQRAQVLKEAKNDPVVAASLALKYGYTGLAEEFGKARETVAKARSEEADLEKKEFSNAYTTMSAYAPLVANGAIPARAVVDTIFKHPVLGKVFSSVMTSDEALAYADKNPQGLAQILATPPDKIYESVTTSRQAKPVEMDLGGKKIFVDSNPQSETYMKSVGEFNKVAPKADVTELKKGERINPDTGRVEAVEGSDIYIAQSGKHGKDFNAVKTIDSATKDALDNVDKILSPENEDAFNSNFGGSTYLGSRYIPGKTQTIAVAIDKLKSTMKATGAQLMRSQGGAVGSITEREWPILEGMVASLKPELPEQDAREIIATVRQRLSNLNDIAKETYDTTWGNTQYYKPNAGGGGKTAPATTPSGVPVLNWD